MDEKLVKVEGYDKGGGQHFHRRNFKNKDPLFKALTIGIDIIVLSYGKPNNAAAFIKPNKALSRYIGLNFKVGGPMETRAIPYVEETYLKLPKYPNDTAGNFLL